MRHGIGVRSVWLGVWLGAALGVATAILDARATCSTESTCDLCINGEWVTSSTSGTGNQCPIPMLCPSPPPPPGKPEMELVFNQSGGYLRVVDTPMAVSGSAGPAFAFTMAFHTGDNRLRHGRHWPIGYRWSHAYEMHVSRLVNSYRVQNPFAGSGGPMYTWNGTNFVDANSGQIGFQRLFELEWEGSNIVAYVPSADAQRLLPTRAGCGHGGGCAGGSCGAHASRPEVNPPQKAWHASESYTFEPGVSSANFYRLKTVTGADGRSLDLQYGTNDLVAAIVTASGNTLRFHYSPADRLTNIHDVTGARDVFFTYTNDLMETVTDMAGNRFDFAYDGEGRMTLLASPADSDCCTNIATVAYSGATVTITHAEGEQTWVGATNGVALDNRSGLGATRRYYETLISGQKIYRIEDPLGRVTSHYRTQDTAPDIAGKTVKAVSPDGAYREYEYDAKGRMSAIRRYHSRAELLTAETILRTDFPGTDNPSNILWETVDANGHLLSRSRSTFDLYDQGTSDPRDDVYVPVSEIRWSATNAWEETRYLWDTNTFYLAEVQVLTNAAPAAYRTTQRYFYDTHGCVVAREDALGHRVEYHHDALDRLVAMGKVMSFGTNLTHYAYDDLDRVIERIDPDGATETWTHTACGCGVLTHTDRLGSLTVNAYDGNGRLLTTETRTTNNTLVAFAAYEYNAAGSRTKITDALGFAVTNVFNAAGELVSAWDALGRATHFRHNARGQGYQTVHPDGTSVSNRFDYAGRLAAVTRYTAETGGTVLTTESYAYDPLGRRVATTDALGNITSNAYDLLGRTVRVTLPDQSYSETEYDLVGNAVVRTGPVPPGASAGDLAAATTTNQYDALNRLVSMTDPEGRVTRQEYDPDWVRQLRHTVNANGVTNRTSLYERDTGRLATNTVDGFTMTFAYDSAGRQTRTTYPDGSFIESLYDGPRLVTQRSRSGNTTTFTYDALNRRVLTENGRGFVTSNAYDAVGNLLSTTDPLTNTTAFAYDTLNRLTVTTRADGSTSTNSYDGLGRLVSRTGAGSVPAFYEYDALSRMTKLIDGEGNVTGFDYDALGRLVKKTYADGSFYTYGYNARGWLTNRVDAMLQHTAYAYNNVGQLTQIDYPTDVDVTYFYDELGRMTSRVDAAGAWAWSYDAESSRMLSESLSSPLSPLPPVQYTYHDKTFDLASVGLDPTNTTHYAWNAGRLTNVAWQVGTDLRAVRYDYLSGSDLIESLIFSDAGLAVTRAYDPADRLMSISATSAVSAVNSFLYTLDAVGRRTAREDADGARTDWGYDDFDQLTAAARTNSPNGAADAAYQFGYQYDLIGNRLHEDRGQQSLPASYNNLKQLTHRGWAGKLDIVGTVDTTGAVVLVQGYTNAPPFYDATNWLGGAVVGPGSNAIPIVALEGTNYSQSNLVVYLPPTNPQVFTYDANGNLLADGQRVYTWDEENRLVAIETVGPSLADTRRSEFLYDGMGRRIVRTDYSSWNGVSYDQTNTTRFIWDGWLLLAEADGAGTLTAYHAHGLDLSGSLQGAGGIGGLLARIESTSTYLYTFDGNGNVTDLVDTNGAVVAHYEYDPFGRTVAQSGSYAEANPWRFSTKQIEAVWGLYYYGYRYYSPQLGRWVNRDPIRDLAFVAHYVAGDSQRHSDILANSPEGTHYLRLRSLERLQTSIFLTPKDHVPQFASHYGFCNNSQIQCFDPLGDAIPAPLAGCLAAGVAGGIGGGLGGWLGSGFTWKGACCGWLGGAVNGCVVGALCTPPTQLCPWSGCVGGFLGSVAQQLCYDGAALNDQCSWFTTIMSTVVGCTGSAFSETEMKEKIVLFLFGLDISLLTGLCDGF